ncbi:MAG TPA: hypothetical protein DHW61_17495, partial [Lachnoclostridium phytofermentans]|nr:hypothetical protein [Lachnoclostridium phytofermentans]
MTTDIDGNYRGVYTYGNGERISVEDLGHVEGVPNNPLYYLSDALGSTVAITNMNAGIIDNNRFAPFGEPLSPVGKNARLTNSPWGFAGESHDIEAELVYLRARYYEPGTSRWLSSDKHWNPSNMIYGDNPVKNNQGQDPLGLNIYNFVPDINAIRQSGNLYVYCMNNPICFRDPSGEDAAEVLEWVWTAAGIISQLDSPIPGPADAAALLFAGTVTVVVGGMEIYNNIFGPTDTSGYVEGGPTPCPAPSRTEAKDAGNSKDKSKGKSKGNKGKSDSKPQDSTSPNQMNKQIEKGQAPRGVKRVDNPDPQYSEPHVHFDDGTSISQSGKIHDAHNGTPNLTKQ